MKKLWLILLFGCAVVSAFPQEYNFSQYYLDKLGISPAFVSVGDYNELGLALRSQWPGVDGGYKVYMAEYQQKLPAYSSGVGARVYGDYAGSGAFSTTCLDLLYGYDFGITGDLKCSMGLSAGFIGRSVRQEGMVYYSMIDPATGEIGGLSDALPYDGYRSLTFGTGIAVYTKETMVALGFQRLANFRLGGEPNYSPMAISAVANHKIKIGGTQNKLERIVVPGVCFSHTRYGDMVMPNVYFSGYRLLLSLGYRIEKSAAVSSSVVMGVGFDLGRVELGIGHEMETSAVARQTNGSYEVGLKYKFEKSEKNSDGKTILCPAF